MEKILVIGGGFAGVSAAYELAFLNNKNISLQDLDELSCLSAKQGDIKDQPITYKIEENSRVEITLAEANDSLGGRIYSPVDHRDPSQPKVVEMGGEFIDGNFDHTLYYCAKTQLDLETVAGWSTAHKGDHIPALSGVYKLGPGCLVGEESLPQPVLDVLNKIEGCISGYAKEFIGKNYAEVVPLEPASSLILVGDDDESEKSRKIDPEPTLLGVASPLSYVGNKVTSIDLKNKFQITTPGQWGELKIGDGFDTQVWKTISVSQWLNKCFPDQDQATKSAKAIWCNMISGEYGNPEHVGLAFVIHQAAIYDFQELVGQGLTDKQNLGLHECMRVKGGNQQIATLLGEQLISAGHKVFINKPVEKIEFVSDDNKFTVTAGGVQCKEAFDYIVLATPAQEYSKLLGSLELEEDFQDLKNININYGIHAKVSVSNASLAQSIDSPINIDGSYWDSTEDNTANPNFCASQVWIESPFLGSSYSMGEQGWLTFYLTHRSKPQKTAKLHTIDACRQWTDQYVFKVGQYLSAGVGEPGSIGVENQPTRYHTGYAAYGPGTLGDKGYLEKWSILITANTQGVKIKGKKNEQLFFAGEHLDDKYVGFMEGALRTGVKASKALARSMFKEE